MYFEVKTFTHIMPRVFMKAAILLLVSLSAIGFQRRGSKKGGVVHLYQNFLFRSTQLSVVKGGNLGQDSFT